MYNRTLLDRKLGIVLSILLLISLACALPLIGESDSQSNKDPIQMTAEKLSTQVIGTQTALVQEILPTAVEVIDDILETAIPAEDISNIVPSVIPVDILTQVPAVMTQVPELPEQAPADGNETDDDQIEHQNIPQDPGVAKVVLEDTSSSPQDGQNVAPPYSEKYDVNLFERPFTQENAAYLPDADIEKAELASDGTFYYFTIYLNNVNPTNQSLNANYAIELDTDKDGRGDFLVWTAPPKSTKWSIQHVSVFTDTNNDVGAETVLKSDAPTSGNGYETLLFSVDQYNDPDIAWSRNSPSNPTAIQIAFKHDVLDNKKSFLWSVWADMGIKNPAKFDYNDMFTQEEAGSPIQDSEYFPVKSLYSMDNTCRMGYGSTLTGNEPGICGEVKPVDVTIPTIEITNIPLPDIPGLP